MKRLTVTLLCLICTAVPGSVCAVEYSVRNLGIPAGFTWSEARDINNAGSVAGFAYGPDPLGITGGVAHAHLWQPNGQSVDLGTLGGDDSYALCMNNAGQVAGWSYSTQGHSAFVWDAVHGMQDVLASIPGALGSEVRGINNNGVMVGVGGGMGCFILDGTQLALLPNMYPYDINLAGLVAGVTQGYAVTADSQGNVTPLDQHNAVSSSPDGGFNEAGWVAGCVDVSANNPGAPWQTVRQPCVWIPGQSRIDLALPYPLHNGIAYAVNNAGLVMGNADGELGQPLIFIWNPLTAQVDLIEGGWGWGMNDAGQIAGTIDVGGQRHATIWTPVPEPSALLALLCGLAGLSGVVRRRAARVA